MTQNDPTQWMVSRPFDSLFVIADQSRQVVAGTPSFTDIGPALAFIRAAVALSRAERELVAAAEMVTQHVNCHAPYLTRGEIDRLARAESACGFTFDAINRKFEPMED